MPLRMIADINGIFIFTVWQARCYMLYVCYLNNKNLNHNYPWVVEPMITPGASIITVILLTRKQRPGDLVMD